MYISMCLYITITILLWVLSIYPFIKHYTIVVSIITIQFSHILLHKLIMQWTISNQLLLTLIARAHITHLQVLNNWAYAGVLFVSKLINICTQELPKRWLTWQRQCYGLNGSLLGLTFLMFLIYRTDVNVKMVK